MTDSSDNRNGAQGKGPGFEVSVGIGTGSERSPARESDPRAPFRILVAGDFTARAHRGVRESASRWASLRPARVDLDRLDEVLGRWCPEVDVPLPGGGSVHLRFKELEDFRPERIAEAPALDRLLEAERSGSPAPDPAADGLLDRILSGAADEELPEEPSGSPFEESLRAALHDPAVRAMEAAWRGIELLVKRLDLDGTGLELHLLDVSRPELEEALLEGDVQKSPLHRLLVERAAGTAGGTPWGALVLLETFGDEAPEMRLLSCLARLGSLAGTPVLAAASPRLVGCRSLAESPDPDDWDAADPALELTWTTVRHMPESAYLALALPRFLVRLPYGERTASVEGFDFEELSDPPRHEEYLWGCPALFLALLLGLGYEEEGWNLSPGDPNGLQGLPLAFEEEDGESVAKPCAEGVTTIRGAEQMGEAGLVPLVTIRGTDTVKIGLFRSIAEPWAPLAGRWKG